MSVRATINYYRRRVTICTPGEDCFQFTGDRLDVIDPFLNDFHDRNSIICLLASLSLSDVDEVRVELPHVLYEFFDVFPDDLPGLSPIRDMEFYIDLLVDMDPISMSPYRFAPAEFVELKKQLLEL